MTLWKLPKYLLIIKLLPFRTWTPLQKIIDLICKSTPWISDFYHPPLVLEANICNTLFGEGGGGGSELWSSGDQNPGELKSNICCCFNYYFLFHHVIWNYCFCFADYIVLNRIISAFFSTSHTVYCIIYFIIYISNCFQPCNIRVSLFILQ